MGRPGAATARPGGGSSSRSGRRGEVSITPRPGRYLETLVVFRSEPAARQINALERLLAEGTVDFQRVSFLDP